MKKKEAMLMRRFDSLPAPPPRRGRLDLISVLWLCLVLAVGTGAVGAETVTVDGLTDDTTRLTVIWVGDFDYVIRQE